MSDATSSITCALGVVEVESPNVKYTDDSIESTYSYDRTEVEVIGKRVVCVPHTETLKFTTQRRVPKVGVMVVGWGGNNGTTVTGGILANARGITWRTKKGMRSADYVGSMTQSSTVRLGSAGGRDVYVPFSSMLPMVHPNDLVLGGWDISSLNLGDAMLRAEVLDVTLMDQLYPLMSPLQPLPAVYFPDFIASNQADRADNVLTGSKQEQMEVIRSNIRDFKARTGVDKVIIMWSANTERFSSLLPGVNDTADNLLAAIAAGHEEVSPSTLYAVASMLEGCSYINGSPQNTFVPGAVELAIRQGVFIGGDDFKSGQTKMKSVLVDFLVSAGIKPVSIASYNHLGNNDGKNLSAPACFRSKEISKSNVVDDMVASNGLLFKEGEHPDHTVVIKYMPATGDSKRALDEYMSEIFLGGINTIAMHNTCEDSLLAAPLIIDLMLLTEVCERISVQRVGVDEAPVKFHSVLSLLSYLCKAPLVPAGAPVINALFKQREALVNVFRACVGLPPENHMMMEHRLPTPAHAPAHAGAGVAVAVADVAVAVVCASPPSEASDGEAESVGMRTPAHASAGAGDKVVVTAADLGLVA